MINASGTKTPMTSVLHEPWCDPAEHALAASAFEDKHGNAIDMGCVSRAVEIDGNEGLGGWWHQDQDGQSEFIIDRGFDVDLSASTARLLDGLLSTRTGTKQLRQLVRGAMTTHAGAAE